MNQLKFIQVPTVQLRYKALLIYNRIYFDENYTSSSREAFKSFSSSKLTYSGNMTKGAKKRIEKAVDLLLILSPIKKVINPITNRLNKFQLTFITLTVSDNTKIHSSKFCIDNLLKPFLRWLKDSKKVKSYVWKLELQERGQPHFHITTNEFIRFDEITNKWNLLQKEYGLLADYFNRFGHYNPNSTDIHQVYKIQDIKAYLVKYLSKSDDNTKNEKVKVWDCSLNLKSSKYFEFEYCDLMMSKFDSLKADVNSKLFSNEHCEIIKNSEIKMSSLVPDNKFEEFKSWYSNLSIVV